MTLLRCVQGLFHRMAIARLMPAVCFLVCLVFLLAAAAGPAGAAGGEDAAREGVTEAAVKGFTLYAARFVEGAAALVITIAALRALGAYLLNVVRGSRGGGEAIPKDEIRLSLGRSLALALEFSLGADILKTAVAPTWNEIGQLAAIAVLRTGLNYFLERELQQAERREPEVGRRAERS